LDAYRMELACKTLAFFGKIPLDIVENTSIMQMMTVYRHTMQGYSEDVDFGREEKLQNVFDWQGDLWEIAPPVLDNNSDMTFGEFLNAKQVIKDLYELGNEKWSPLLGLCCVYFRKKGEAYNESLSTGERMELLKTLPFPYALQVAFFLKISQDSWRKTFLSSEVMEGEAALN
jgi:hypothetical protein